MATPLYNLRPAEGADTAFIYSSWLKRFRDAVSVRLVTDKVFYATQHKIITAILAQPDLKVITACDPADSNHIYGYAVGQDLDHLVPGLVVVHFIYTKGPFRRYGIGKALAAALTDGRPIVHYTHKTHLVPYLNKANSWVFNPAFLWSLI